MMECIKGDSHVYRITADNDLLQKSYEHQLLVLTQTKLVLRQWSLNETLRYKTAHCYGPAKICVSSTVFHPVVCHEESGNVVLMWNGESMSSVTCGYIHVEQNQNWKRHYMYSYSQNCSLDYTSVGCRGQERHNGWNKTVSKIKIFFGGSSSTTRPSHQFMQTLECTDCCNEKLYCLLINRSAVECSLPTRQHVECTYTVSQKKLCHFYFYCNFGKCWSIFNRPY